MRHEILFVTPHPSDAVLLSEMVSSMDLGIKHVSSMAEAKRSLIEESFPLLVTESVLEDGTWRDLLEIARASFGQPPVIVTDPFADAHVWAEVIHLGAHDLIVQPFRGEEVRRILGNACREYSTVCAAPTA